MQQRIVRPSSSWTDIRDICLVGLTTSTLAILFFFGSGPVAARQNPGSAANPPQPCCTITNINRSTGTISARNNASGQTFEFKLTNQQALQSLKVGQGVFANFGARQVSLDGKAPSGTIVAMGPATPSIQSQPSTAGNSIKGQVNTAGPCCEITAIASPSVITARTSAGAYFVFAKDSQSSGSGPLLSPVLTVGQKVFANLNTKQVSLDGSHVFGKIEYLCTPPPPQPCPTGAATCQMAPYTILGCPTVVYQTSTPTSCKQGYYGAQCTPCSCSPPQGICSDGINGNGSCTSQTSTTPVPTEVQTSVNLFASSGTIPIAPQCGGSLAISCPGGTATSSSIQLTRNSINVSQTAAGIFAMSASMRAVSPKDIPVEYSGISCGLHIDTNAGGSPLTVNGKLNVTTIASGNMTIYQVTVDPNLSLSGLTGGDFSLNGGLSCQLSTALSNGIVSVVESELVRALNTRWQNPMCFKGTAAVPCAH